MQFVEGILKSALPAKRKLQLIEEIAKLITEFEALSKSKPYEGWKVFAEEFASSRGLKRIPLDKQSVKALLRKAIEWLIQSQHEDGGWGWPDKTRFAPRARKMRAMGKRLESPSLPWDTAVALLALQNWEKHFEEPKVQSLVEKGLEWLIHNQNKDGGWGGLIWVRSKSPSNAIETGAALWVLHQLHGCKKDWTLTNGFKFLENLQHKEGGYSLQPCLSADVKSTAISIALNHLYENNLEQVARDVSWLLEQQERAGNWRWERKPYSRIDATFYAIEALHWHYRQTCESWILEALKVAINWYQEATGLVMSQGEVGWAWEGIENTAAAIVALLDSGESDSCFSIERGIEWLIAQYKPSDCWGYDTSLVILALIRYLEPKSRIINRLAIQGQLAEIKA